MGNNKVKASIYQLAYVAYEYPEAKGRIVYNSEFFELSFVFFSRLKSFSKYSMIDAPEIFHRVQGMCGIHEKKMDRVKYA